MNSGRARKTHANSSPSTSMPGSTRSSARSRSTASPTKYAAAADALHRARRQPAPAAQMSTRALRQPPAAARIPPRRPRRRPPSWRRARPPKARETWTRCARCWRLSRAACCARPQRSSCSPTAIRRRASCSSAKRPDATRTSPGVPFVGRSGKLLDRMMAAIGLDRTQSLYRQHRALAAARQPHADAAGNRDLPALHPPPDRARRSRHPRLPRAAVDADACSAPRKESRERAGAGSNSTPAAAKSARWRPTIPPSCCAARCKSGSPGAIFWR